MPTENRKTREKKTTMDNETEGRPAGNAAAMREALENLLDEAEHGYEIKDAPVAGAPGERQTYHVVDAEYIIDTIRAALAKPARNCDVGTADEQAERFDAFCAAHHFQSENCCSDCPCHGVGICEFKWGQLPYGGKEE